MLRPGQAVTNTDPYLTMRLLLPLLFASAAAAELTFTASTVQDGKEVDVSTKDFVKMPPRSRPHHRWRGTNSTGGSSSSEHKRATSISLSSTWCGMSQKHADSQDPIKTVFGAFQAPNLHDRTGTYPQFAAAWVGIDGSSCQQALLQAGVTTTVCCTRLSPLSARIWKANMSCVSSTPTAARAHRPGSSGTRKRPTPSPPPP